jgi:subtilisin family serine protease
MRRTWKLGQLLVIISLSASVFWNAGCLVAGTASSDPLIERKVEPRVLEGFASGFPQRLIVLFEDSSIQTEASSQRVARRLPYEDSQIIQWKKDRFRELKDKTFNSALSNDINLVRDYDHLPMGFVEFGSEESLVHFISQPEVAAVFKNYPIYPTVAGDLALIDQPQLYSLGYGGNGAVVAVLDTGVNYTTNSAFGPCTAPGMPAGCKVVVAMDANLSNPSGTPLDTNGHGTNVAGIVLEVAPNASIADIKIFDANASATDADVINGINSAIAYKTSFNIVAINMSLGDNGDYTAPCTNPYGSTNPYISPINNALGAGIISVTASGNDGYTNGISSPACTPGNVSVGAVYDSNIGSVNWGFCSDNTTGADRVTCWSNSASFLTMLAPGVDITAAGSTYSGTSQATPHVAAAAAVFRAAFPDEAPAETIARLTASGVPVTDSRNGVVTPRLDVYGALVPANDLFTNATTLSSASGSVSGYNEYATKQVGEPEIAGNQGGSSVWFSWTPAGSGWVSFNTLGSSFDTLLAVYVGTDVNQLSLVASDSDDGPGNTSSLSFYAQAGTTYDITVDGFNAATGSYVLNWGPLSGSTSVPALSPGGFCALCALMAAWLVFKIEKRKA